MSRHKWRPWDDCGPPLARGETKPLIEECQKCGVHKRWRTEPNGTRGRTEHRGDASAPWSFGQPPSCPK